MKKRLFVVFAFISLLLIAFESMAAVGDKNISLGYELSPGFDDGESPDTSDLILGLNLGAGLELDNDNEVRLDFMFQRYSGTWDASWASWASQGKNINDANAYFAGIIASLRAYILRQDLKTDSLNPYLQIGLGYYYAKWEDIHPEDGTAWAWALVPAAGINYMMTPRFGVGLEIKKHFLNSDTKIDDLSSSYINLIYKW